jgi:hypothetical protein
VDSVLALEYLQRVYDRHQPNQERGYSSSFCDGHDGEDSPEAPCAEHLATAKILGLPVIEPLLVSRCGYCPWAVSYLRTERVEGSRAQIEHVDAEHADDPREISRRKQAAMSEAIYTPMLRSMLASEERLFTALLRSEPVQGSSVRLEFTPSADA